jgi:hypothetical protein
MRFLQTRLLCACTSLCLVGLAAKAVHAGPVTLDFVVTARATTIDGQTSDQDQGTFASTSVSQGAADGSLSSGLVFGQPDFGALMGGRVFVSDKANSFNSGSGAIVNASMSDTIQWVGPGPAPNQVLLTVLLDGEINGGLDPGGRSAGGLARARVDDHVTQTVAGNISHQALVNSSINAGFGAFSWMDSFALNKNSLADEYSFGIFFEASASANEGWIEIDTRNTFGLLDVTLADGTSVLNQIQFASGLTPSTNPNPVPEPTSMALFGIGLLGTGVITRRRDRRRPAA